MVDRPTSEENSSRPRETTVAKHRISLIDQVLQLRREKEKDRSSSG